MVAVFVSVLLIVAGAAVIIDQLDPDAKNPFPLWVAFVVLPLALAVYKQSRIWGGRNKGK
jgi:hypothetical protein